MVDTLHKLFLTSLLGFVSADAQIQVGLVVVILYACLLLVERPYLHTDNDRLHLLCQAELFLLLLCGLVFQSLPIGPDGGYDYFTDVAMSVVLIVITIFFFLVFVQLSKFTVHVPLSFFICSQS